jgi:UDP-glucuronate 4-epimerase
MKIFVTGCAGFIGFHTAKALLDRGDTVVGLDNFNSYYDPALKEARVQLLHGYPNFRLTRGSILDFGLVAELVGEMDRVCHLAAMAGVRYSFQHPEEYVGVNLQGFFHIIEAVKQRQIPGLIYASTSSVYGANEKYPSSEDDRVDQPLSLYAMTKRANELMAHAYRVLHGVRSTGLRFFSVYGPWGRPDLSLFLFTRAILAGEPINVFGHGQMQRDFTFVKDIVSGILAALDRNYEEEIFNLGAGRREELMDLIALIEKACGKEAKKEFLPMQPGDVRASLADISKAQRLLGYEPKTMIQEGVPAFVHWYREHYRV